VKQGQGDGTLDKERKIGSAESIGMRMANFWAKKNAWRQTRPYFHLDLNAGSGWNEIAGCPGSPMVFCELAQRQLTAMPVYAWFCDYDAAAIAKLEHWLVHYGHLPQSGLSLLCEDNKSVIGRFAEQVRRRDRPQHALGSLLCDPNAWFYRAKNGGGGVPVDEVIQFAEEFLKIDIILNINYRWYSQAQGKDSKLRLVGKEEQFAALSPDEIRTKLKRRHWLVSRQTFGKNRFWLAIGRNHPTGDHRKLGMYHWDSEEGLQIMNMVNGERQGNFQNELELSVLERKRPSLLSFDDDEGEEAA
jgi:hypothetical protein